MTKFGLVFLVVLLAATALAAAQHPPATARLKRDPTVLANERLTALAGATLFLLVIAIAGTTLVLPQFLPQHYFVGLLMVPPLLVKLASTGYRFVRYYTGSEAFRLAGPPPLLLRFGLAPALVASTLVVFGTGIELWLFGLRFGSLWATAHTLSAVVFVLAAGGHVIAHLRRSAGAVLGELGASASRPRFSQGSLVVASLLLGAILAASSLLYATPFPSAAVGP